jgi:hypothetical protein
MRNLVAIGVLLASFQTWAAPIPEDKRALVGDWEGHGINLTITEGGQITFKKQSGSFSKSISGFFTGFEGNDLKVNAFITTLTIHIQEPPHQDRGVWVMTVEGDKVLKKPSAPAAPDVPGGRRERITAAIKRDMEGKGVPVKSLFCPSDAENKDLFACILTTDVGDVFPVKCIIDAKGTMRFESEAALIDPKVLEKAIVDMFAKKPGGKADVTCLKGTIMKKVGASFGCIAKNKGRDYPVKVTVKDIAGNVHIEY